MLGSLTKKGGQQCPQHIKMSLQVAEKELIKERPCRSSTKNSRNCVDISSVQRSVEWECQGYMPTIKRRSVSSGSLLSEGTVKGNRDRGRTDSGTEGPLTSLIKVGKGVQSVRAQQNPWRRCRWTGEEVGKHQKVSRGSHDLRGHKELKINNVEWPPRIVVFWLTLYHPHSCRCWEQLDPGAEGFRRYTQSRKKRPFCLLPLFSFSLVNHLDSQEKTSRYRSMVRHNCFISPISCLRHPRDLSRSPQDLITPSWHSSLLRCIIFIRFAIVFVCWGKLDHAGKARKGCICTQGHDEDVVLRKKGGGVGVAFGLLA